MTKEPPNPLQKLVRGVIRDFINQANSQKADKPVKRKKKELAKTKSQSNSEKRSRHIPTSVRVSVLHRDGYKCVFCGRGAPNIELEVDHIVPFSKGGSNDIRNLQTLCFDCNRGKGARRLIKKR